MLSKTTQDRAEPRGSTQKLLRAHAKHRHRHGKRNTHRPPPLLAIAVEEEVMTLPAPAPPDGQIPGYFLRRGESYVISLRANKREGVGVYECVRVLNAS